jgi:multiple sugar transport system substrate-binding protein
MSSNPRRARTLVRGLAVAMAAATAITMAGCASTSGSDNGKVTLKFSQWWEPELPAGDLKSLMDEFHKENPNITVDLVSNPYTATQQQTFAAAAAGKLADVVGLDGTWVNQLAKQGALDNLSDEMKQHNFDTSQLSSQVKYNGSTYSIPAVNFVYTLFTNDDLLKQAGVDSVPTTRTEFENAAVAVATKTKADPWALPLGLSDPSGVQNCVMAWVWASGGSMLTKDGKPNLTGKDVTSAITFIKDVYDKGGVAQGALTLQQQDMVQSFANGQTAMMIDSLAHVNTIRKANPNLKFTVSAEPSEDGYTGKKGIPFASWGVGVSKNSAHKDAAWKLVSFLMSKEANGKLATSANGFPGNKTATPDFTGQDPQYESAFKIYQSGYPANEFDGLPQGQQLLRSFDEQLQALLSGKQSVKDTLTNAQAEWTKVF